MSTYAYRKQELPPRVTRTRKAALYIRLSKDDGDKAESDSVINQKKFLSGFVESQPDIEFAGYYVDDGWSGASFERPDFMRMMSDVYARRIDCVIVKDSSRFGRNASESGRYIQEVFPKYGVRYIAVNDAIDSGKSRSVAIDFLNTSFRGIFNEFYVAENSEKIRSTLDMERRQGDFIGSFAKFGYKKDPADRHKLLIDEEAAEIVRLIYRMYLSGSGIRTIVRYLNDNGIVNPSTYKSRNHPAYKPRSIGTSPLWSDKTVRRILHDEMYIGNMVQGKHRKVSYKNKTMIACDKYDWFRVEDTHEAIIRPEDFDRVQRMLDSHAKSSPADGEIGLFSGLLRCADCGHALIKKTNHNPDKTYVYYRCSTYCKCKTACTAHTIRYEKLYDTVLITIQKMLELAADADKVMKEMKSHRSVDNDTDIKKQIAAQEKKMEKIKNLLTDLYPDYKEGILSKEQYLINKQRYEQEQENLTSSITRLRASVNNSDSPTQTNEFIEHFKQHGSIDRLTRPLLTELIDHIKVSEDGSLTIVFRFRDAFLEAQQAMASKRSA